MTEREKMIAGELYRPTDPELSAARLRARRLFKAYNDSGPDELDRRRTLLDELLGAHGETILIEPPFYCDYGFNIEIGDNFFSNFNCVFLDCGPIKIGRNVMFAPGVQLYAATHPLNAAQRNSGQEYGGAITIGDDVWLGGNVIVGPNVTIGRGTTIGAGSVVTRDVPEGVLAYGNPCRVVRTIA